MLNSENANNIYSSNKIDVMMEILSICSEIKEKVLVFSGYTEPLDLIENILKNKIGCCRMDGKMTQTKRNEQIKQFIENKEKQVFLLTTGAGGVGLNLTVACRVILLDVDWNPAVDSEYNAFY